MLIAPLERASEYHADPVRVLGIAQTSDQVALDQKADITTFIAVQQAAQKAYKMAGVTAKDIQFAELHDCFTIAEIVAMEDLGFVEKGQGGPYVLEGRTCLKGERPVNTSGGLKSKGHPVGATGVAQICESYWQLTKQAGALQVSDARIALTHVTGGGIFGVDNGACAVHILSNR